MEKIKPAVDAAAIKARMLKDEKGSLVRLFSARSLFLWTGLAYFSLVLASIGGLGTGQVGTLVSQAAFVAYPVFLMALALLAHAAWAHAAYVRWGRKSVPVADGFLALAFLALALPHFGVDAHLFKALTGVELTPASLASLLNH